VTRRGWFGALLVLRSVTRLNIRRLFVCWLVGAFLGLIVLSLDKAWSVSRQVGSPF